MYSGKQANIDLSDLDRPLLGIFIGLVAIGWLMIFAVNYNAADPFEFLSLSHNAGKQLFFIVVCTALMFFVLMTDWAFWRTFGFVLYILSLLVLIGPLFVGREINGANAWYQLGGFSFQPSEIAKFGTCLAMASFLSGTGSTLRTFKNRITAVGIFLVPVLIIILEKDTGSALVFFSFLLVLYREGFPPIWYVLGLGSAALVILGLAMDPIHVIAMVLLVATAWLITRIREDRYWWWGLAAVGVLTLWWGAISRWVFSLTGADTAVLDNWSELRLVLPTLFMLALFVFSYFEKNVPRRRQLQIFMTVVLLSAGLVKGANFACYSLLAPHQQQRIRVWLQPTTAADARGAAYNLMHSKMAIGSGGFAGKGFLDGKMTKLKYVPEQSTDFIFCTVGEEHGFLGVVGLVILFTLLLYRISIIAERQRSNFSRVYAYGVAGIIFIHFIVNVGMTMGLFPIIGIPLPFISYGGSNLIGFTLMIGVLLKLDNHRNQA